MLHFIETDTYLFVSVQSIFSFCQQIARSFILFSFVFFIYLWLLYLDYFVK